MLHNIRWTYEKIDQRLRLIAPLVYARTQRLSPFRLLELEGPVADPLIAPGVDDSGWRLVPWDSDWGEADLDFVLFTTFQVPPGWGEDGPLALFLPIGVAGDFSHPEALVYIDGQPYAACDRHHQEVLLDPRWCDGQPHALALHGWTGGTHDLRFDQATDTVLRPTCRMQMGACQVVEVHQPTRDLLILARVALGTARHIDEHNPTRAHLLNALDEAFKVLDTREPFGPGFYDSVPAALEVLQEAIASSGPPLDVDITAAGHAHIDVAWLWTLGQTRHKCGRTFHTVLRLMEQFPDYCFTQSQPQLYDYVRQDYPGLFESIRQRVGEGRWEPIGGTWVEPDCNLSGGESLARQFLLGLTFYRQHFGDSARTPVLWLPDVFGYACNLPQLVREAGLEYFFTIKIGWSQYNRFPYDSFWWQGLDGSRILTHFSPTKDSGSAFASTYNALATPDQVLSSWTNFQQQDWGPAGTTPPLLMVYGYGDGGGGPTREMLENIGQMDAFPALPRVKCGSVASFFEKLEARVGDRLPTWNGELYLEYHRGTYTTQARNKRANRKSEFLLHDAEFLAALASTLDPTYDYPHPELRRAWELVCLNQFHDIIPGSSIGAVYVESLTQYAEVEALGEGVCQAALGVVADRVGGDLLVVNPTSFTRHDLAFLPGQGPELPTLRRGDNGHPVRVQAVDDGLLLDAGPLAPYSVTPLVVSDLDPGLEQSGRRTGEPTPNLLENDFLRVELDDSGDIVRIYDKTHQREVLPHGTIANQFQAFEDRPKTPDAWEIDIYYDDKMWSSEPASSVTVVESGPLRATLEVRRRVLHSDIVQRISLTHDSARLDFETVVQWRERHVMLKVAFPVDVLSPTATYEVQFGNVERPTHRNTSWDWARFEVAAQKWADLSEGGYGVSLLNDCKYGHDIYEQVMRLTLLRGPTDPDPEADLGEHCFTYSLLPHGGGWDEVTISQAYALNDPLFVWPAGAAVASSIKPFIEAAPANVVIETVKQAEDEQGLIVRLYESQRCRGAFTLTTGFEMAAAWRTDLLEENQHSLEVQGNMLHGEIKPYQILTLRLLPAGPDGEAIDG